MAAFEHALGYVVSSMSIGHFRTPSPQGADLFLFPAESPTFGFGEVLISLDECGERLCPFLCHFLSKPEAGWRSTDRVGHFEF